MTLAPAKDPKKVKAGQAGMRSRWGPPRIVRLDTLEPPVRMAILALVDADRAAKEKTSTVSDAPVLVGAEQTSDAQHD